MAESDYTFKVLVLGEAAIGKTSLLLRCTDNTFTEGTVSPPSEDFKSRTFTINGKSVTLDIWDTQGQERFRTVTSSYYRGAHGMLVVYDLTNAASFEKVRQWVDDVDRYSTNQSSKILVGNKLDLADKRVVSEAEGQQLANELKLPFSEASAKTGANVEKIFLDLATACVSKELPQPKRQILGLAPPPKEKRKKDCVLL